MAILIQSFLQIFAYISVKITEGEEKKLWEQEFLVLDKNYSSELQKKRHFTEKHK